MFDSPSIFLLALILSQVIFNHRQNSENELFWFGSVVDKFVVPKVRSFLRIALPVLCHIKDYFWNSEQTRKPPFLMNASIKFENNNCQLALAKC
jgi:hypothetical protein